MYMRTVDISFMASIHNLWGIYVYNTSEIKIHLLGNMYIQNLVVDSIFEYLMVVYQLKNYMYAVQH